MLVDSHCHLDRIDLTPYAGDFARFRAATRAAGVAHMLCVSIDLEHYPAMRALVADAPEVSISVGVHPNEPDRHTPDVDELVALAADPKNVAIGETGLDYFRSEGDLDWQRERFRIHIAAARACGKPLIVHTRAAAEDTLAILRAEQAAEAGGVMHCFSETWEVARAALDLGFYISFSGILTFKNAASLREVARNVPLERLLVETDSPYLAPVPVRGKPNEPRHVVRVAEVLARERGLGVDEIAALTSANFHRAFPAARPSAADRVP